MSHNLAVCPVCGGNEIEREECANCGTPISRFVERKTGRGGLRNPPGGRPKKPEGAMVSTSIRLPAELIEWLAANVGNRNEWIIEAIKEKINRDSQNN